MQGKYLYPLRARKPRKITLTEDEVLNIRDETKNPPILTHLYFSGGATVEIGNEDLAVTEGFPVLSDSVYVDNDTSNSRFMLSTGEDTTLFIQEFDI